MACIQCGKCCEGIGITAPMKLIARMNTTDAKFIRENWREVPLQKAMRLNERLREHHAFSSFFVCSKFDRRTNKCTAQGTKPYVCSGYPFYDKGLFYAEAVALDEGCGYNREKLIARIICLLKLKAGEAKLIRKDEEKKCLIA